MDAFASPFCSYESHFEAKDIRAGFLNGRERPTEGARKLLVANARTKFELDKMKRYFGEPLLAGDETMEQFNEYALGMADSLDPGDAAAHVITYLYILESHWYMRLVRFRGHSARDNGMSMKTTSEASRRAKISASEAAALLNLQRTFALNEKLDFLITQSSKRINSLLSQIAMHRISLAEALRRRLEMEEKKTELDYKKMLVKKEEEMQAVKQEQMQMRLEQERKEKQIKRDQMIKQMQQKGDDKVAAEQPTRKLEDPK